MKPFPAVRFVLSAALLLSPAAWTQTIPNPSFEADHYFSGVGYASQNGGVITGWTLSDPARIGLNVGGTNNPAGLVDNGAIPNGTNVAFVQASGGSTAQISTVISGLTSGVQYQVTFRANRRSAYQAPQASISLNGGVFFPIVCSPPVGGANAYYVNSMAFVATSNTAPLVIQNTTAVTNDATLLVDNFTIAPLATVVSNTADSGAGSLRTILANAPGGAVITFAPALSGQSILLTSGEMVLTKYVTIDAAALANGIQINGNGASRIFTLETTQAAVMNALTLTNGNGNDKAGAVYCKGSLMMNQCTLAGNVATNAGLGWGGAILVEGLASTTLKGCTLSGNRAVFGGAIFGVQTSLLTLNESTLAGNRATNSTGWGGGLFVQQNATATANNCTFSGNQANKGGAIANNQGDSLTINQCTLAGNVATTAGALDSFNCNALAINQSTIVSNVETCCGGTVIVSRDTDKGQTATLANSIIYGITGNPDADLTASGGFSSVTHSLISVNPKLAPLGNYGGRTQTMPPLASSPAINDADDSITNSFPTDQRGFPRAIGFHVDIGAAEATNAPFAPSAVTQPASLLTFTSASFNAAISIGGTNTSYYYQYGLTTNYGSFSPTNIANYSDTWGTTVNVSLTNAPNNNYHFRVVASNPQGVAVGGDVLLTGLETRTWIPLANPPPGTVGHFHLLSDGTVIGINMTTNYGPRWLRLTPDAQGSYVNGTWSSTAAMADTRLDFSSQVLRDGRLWVAGGEYGSGGNKSEIYDPVLNTWTQIPVPANLSVNISDASSMLLPDGRVLVAPVAPATNNLTIIYDPVANTWTNADTTLGSQSESDWVKLPDNSILTVDFLSTNSERYIPSLGKWIGDSPAPFLLTSVYGGELGPSIMLPNGKAICFGDHGKNAIYTPSGSTNAGSWIAAPDFPNGQGMPDSPAAMLANGKILCVTTLAPYPRNTYNSPMSFFEYDPVGNKFTGVSAPGGGTVFPEVGFAGLMLALPDGNILFTHRGSDLYVYQPTGTPLTNGQPNIQGISQNADGSLHFSGTMFNGLSAGASYGDDEQTDSNYPLVRFTSTNGIVRYGRTYNWSSAGVQTGTNVVTTESTIPAGASLQDKVEVVANGIASPQLSYPIALDNTGLTWSSTGNAIWGIQTGVTHDGVDAAHSGTITNSQTSSITTTIVGTGLLTFWWKVSSEVGFDFLRFYLDGVEQVSAPGISGEVNWQQRIVTIPTGTHTLTWTYSKDGSVSAGLDAGWLDQVAFGSTQIATTNDSGLGSLREAVANLPSGRTVTFAANLSGQTIGLSNGQITFSNNITIDASALAKGLTLSGLNTNRVLIINPGVTSVLTGLTITGGNGAGAAPVANYGGAIFNQGNLTLSNCYVVANSGFAGGGIYNSLGDRLTLHACTLATNSASYGGAIQNEGTLLADNTTFTANSATQEGGAISAPFSSLTALTHCTLSGNNGNNGGGVLGANILLTNSIVAANTATLNPNISGAFTVGGNNLTNGSPLLDALANYGGPTPTMRPFNNSPAIDAGSDAAASGLSFDQRGRSRTSGIHVDLGAVEVTTNSIVTTIADSGADSLRTVVANIESGFNVTFANAIAGQTITLNSQVILDHPIVIDGTGSGIQISGNNIARIFFVNNGINATLNQLTLKNGFASQGGAIQNNGSLTLNHCTLAGNRDTCGCGINGGAVLNRGTLTANNSTFSGNSASFGGAIFNDSSSTLMINQSTFNGNIGTNGGGAIYNFQGTMTVNQSTIVGNQSPGGGSQGGGINNSGFGFFLTNSIVCLNTALSSPNIAGVVTPFSSPNNLVDANPQLAAFGNYGGPTTTMPPLPGSPVIDAGNDLAASSFTTDQRGLPRLLGSHVDIGAVELQVIVATNPPVLTGLKRLTNGIFQFGFTNLTSASFTIFASTNVTLPIASWTVLGAPIEVSPGHYQFTDPQASNTVQRFYRVRSP